MSAKYRKRPSGERISKSKKRRSEVYSSDDDSSSSSASSSQSESGSWCQEFVKLSVQYRLDQHKGEDGNRAGYVLVNGSKSYRPYRPLLKQQIEDLMKQNQSEDVELSFEARLYLGSRMFDDLHQQLKESGAKLRSLVFKAQCRYIPLLSDLINTFRPVLKRVKIELCEEPEGHSMEFYTWWQRMNLFVNLWATLGMCVSVRKMEWKQLEQGDHQDDEWPVPADCMCRALLQLPNLKYFTLAGLGNLDNGVMDWEAVFKAVGHTNIVGDVLHVIHGEQRLVIDFQ